MREQYRPRVHGVSGYRGGCRCDECRSAVRDQRRKDRAARPTTPPKPKAATPRPNVVALPGTGQPVQQHQPGPVEAAVRVELGPLAESHPVIVAQCIAVAAKIDDPDHGAVIARNCNELDRLRAELRGPRKKLSARTGQLATISTMAGRRKAAAQ